MNKISAVVIAKNEENLIEDCLESLSFCSEIIVIDNGSTDKTKEISEKKGAKVFKVESNDFSFLRNAGLEKAENDWLLYLDADERIDDKLKSSIESAIKSNEFTYYFLNRRNFYLGKNPWPYAEKMQRLFKKSYLKHWVGQLHETPVTEGSGGQLKGYILHFTHRDLESMVNKTLNWSTIEAVTRYNQNHPQMTWWRFPRVMIGAFLNSYIRQGGYKAKTAGIIESIYQSFSIFITYAKLWELQKAEKIKQK